MNERASVEANKTNTIDNKKLKIFLLFLIVIIIGVTVFMVVKKQKDIEDATTNPSIPNQADVAN